MAGTLRLSNTGTGNGQSTITTAASGDTTYTLPSGGGTFVTTGSTQALTVAFASGTVSAPSITFLGDSNTGIYSPAADTIAFTEGGVEALRIDSSGQVGIGTSSPSNLLDVSQASSTAYVTTDQTNTFIQISNPSNASANIYGGIKFRIGGGVIGGGAGSACVYGLRENGAGNSPGTALTFGTTNSSNVYGERVRIDASGRLLVGTSTSTNNSRLQQKLAIVHAGLSTYPGIGLTAYAGGGGGPFIDFNSSRGTTDGSMTVLSSGDPLGYLVFRGADGTNFVNGAEITAYVDGAPGANDMPGRLVFSTTADGASSPTERMRISNTGTVLTYSTDDCISARASQGAGTSYFFYRGMQGASSTTAGGTTSFIVYTNGNVQNTNNSYAGISDLRLKENIVDATSQWADIKALQVRKYNFKEETGQQTHTQIGLIAQEVEFISPGLVTESPDRDAEGNDLCTTTKSVNYSVLYMKAVKALQEAMERIEQLETEMAAVKAQLL